MPIKHISQKDLDTLYKKELKKVGKKEFEEIKREAREKTKTGNGNNSIFLCHSHLDKTIVNKIWALFRGFNIDLYIDWMDKGLSAQTDKNTASAIKDRIDESEKFLFLATYNALKSKWCNWELGLAYASKGENDFAILPIETKTGKWSGSEYLQLYPEMQIDFLDQGERLITESDIKININNERLVTFKDWLILSNK